MNPKFFAGALEMIVRRGIGLLLAVVGAGFLYGGLIAILFKTITDAVALADAQ